MLCFRRAAGIAVTRRTLAAWGTGLRIEHIVLAAMEYVQT